MQLKYQPAKWQKKIYKEHRPTCGCNSCFKKSIKNKKLKKPPTIDYFEYINSELWVERKEAYYRKHKKQCKACGSYKLINLHHMVYGNFGNEPDNAMICLCDLCHKEFHAIYQTTRDLRQQTNQFIAHKQATIRRIIKELSP